MEKSSHPHSIFIVISAVLLSFIAGFTNGLLGAGSGIIFMLVSRLVNKNDADGKRMYTFAVMCVIPVSVVSLLMYPGGLIGAADIAKLLPLGIIGGYLGAVVKKRINAALLGIAFAAITVYSGISMFVRA